MTNIEILMTHDRFRLIDILNSDIFDENQFREYYLLNGNSVIREYGPIKDGLIKHFNNNTAEYLLLPQGGKI